MSKKVAFFLIMLFMMVSSSFAVDNATSYPLNCIDTATQRIIPDCLSSLSDADFRALISDQNFSYMLRKQMQEPAFRQRFLNALGRHPEMRQRFREALGIRVQTAPEIPSNVLKKYRRR